MLTPGRTPPDESAAVPVMPPPMPWAIAGTAPPARIASANRQTAPRTIVLNLIRAPSLTVEGSTGVEELVAHIRHRALSRLRVVEIQEAGRMCRLLKSLEVPEEGVEPSRPCGHGILSPARL